MIIQNNLHPTAFGANYDTEYLIRCVANRGKRTAERLNFVKDINKLKKNEAKELLRNTSLIDKYASIAQQKINIEYPGFDKIIKELESTSDENLPVIIEKFKNCYGDTLEITQRSGRSYLS